MAQKLKNAAGTFAVVLLGGWLYSLLVVPFVEGGAVKSVGPTIQEVDLPDAQVGSLVDLGPWLPPGCPQGSLKKTIAFQRGSVHFEDWSVSEDGHLEAKPFVMVLHQSKDEMEGDPESTPPLVLLAREGAILEFDRPFTAGLEPAGRLVKALLRKDVIIHRTARPGCEDGLEIRTSNVQIEPDRIFTRNDVDFRMGAHEGSGSNLEIVLATDRAAERNQLPDVRGIRSLELVHLHQLRIAGTPDAEIPAGNRSNAEGPAVGDIEVQCEGSFTCRLDEQVATFKDNVRIVHSSRDGGRVSDSLACDTLKILFHHPESQSVRSADRLPLAASTARQSTPEAGGAQSAFNVRRLIAQGKPAILHSPLRELHAESEIISYDPIQRSVSMSDTKRVVVKHQDLVFEAPLFNYEFVEGNQLGIAVAEGRGRVVRPAAENGPGFEMEWSEQLQLRPHEGLQCLSFYGSPKLAVSTGEKFTSDELHVWLSEGQAEVLAPRGGPTPTRIQLVKLLAENNVLIDSPQLGGSTDRLEVFWNRDFVRTDEQGSGRAGVSAGTSAGGDSMTMTSRPKEAGPRKMMVSGEFVRARLKPENQTFTVEEITVDGNARLYEQPHPEHLSEMQKPFAIAGRMLQVNALGSARFSAYVVAEESAPPIIENGGGPQGVPIMVAQGMELYGAQMQLDQVEQRMWMDGSGFARLQPVAKQQGAQRLNGPMTVRWKGGLDFDGEWIRVRENVQIGLQTVDAEGELSTVEIQSEGLDLRLAQKVDLAGGGRGLVKSEANSNASISSGQENIETLILQGQVWVTHWETDKQGNTKAVDRLFALGAGLHYPTGNLIAGGPGFTQSIRTQNGLNQISGTGVDTYDSANGSGRTHVRIEFNRDIKGNIYQRHLAFNEDVRVYSVEVPRWDSWLEREQLQQRSDLVFMKCDQLTTDEVMVQRNAPMSLLVQATGNAGLRGRGIEARATRMTYDQSKDLLTLVAEGRDDAELTRQIQPGANPDQVRAREIKFWRGTNQVEVSGISSLSSGAPLGRQPSSKPPNRPQRREQ